MTSSTDQGRPFAPKPKSTPLPKLQLTILALVIIADPIAFTQIFPYVNQMMEDLKVTNDPSRIGFYSGLIDSIFAVAQLCTTYRWGRLSDRIGRKPIALMGLTGIALSTICFGLSNSLFAAVVSRSLAGALASNGVVAQSVMSELTDSTNQARVFPLGGLIWSLGCIIGPMIGGTLSHPATRYPEVFGRIQFFHIYPYFLPCLVSAAFTMLSLGIGAAFFEETLPSKVKAKKILKDNQDSNTNSYGTMRPTSALPSPAIEISSSKPLTAVQILSRKNIRIVLASGFMLAFLQCTFDVVLILFAYTTLNLGGLQRTPAEIGSALALGGIFQAFQQTIMFHRIHARLGTPTMYRVFMMVWPFCFIIFPFVGYVARHQVIIESDLNPKLGWPFWVSFGTVLILGRVACMCYANHIMTVKSVAPSQETLGSMFGLSQTVMGVARSIAPAFVSSLFALSIDKQILGGNLVWIVMTALGLLGVIVVSQLEEQPPTTST